jgi:hypothetical protein
MRNRLRKANANRKNSTPPATVCITETAGSSSHHPAGSIDSASKPAIKPATRSNVVGWMC